MSPQKWLVLWLLGLVVVGAGLLSLPPMTRAGGLAPIDALFTAATSVCVTGLMVLDIEHDFTLAGQLVILALVQLGGIGIITLASLLILSAASRLPLDYEHMMSSTVAVSGPATARAVTLSVVRLTLVIEAAGAVILYLAWPDDGSAVGRAWSALFHAVSAFCNSGIGLYADSLEAFRGDLAVNATMMALIVLGGFGFINLTEIQERVRTRTLRWSRLSLFLKVSVVFTLALNLGAAALLLGLEFEGAFAGLPLAEKMLAALFQSVTTRTAGFDTVPMSEFKDSSLRLMMGLMFVGAASGSCAGGVKLGTLAVLVAIFRSYLRNDSEPVLFNRRLSRTDQRKAVVLFAAFAAIYYVGFEGLLFLEGDAVAAASGIDPTIAIGFETISALGTVGLSTGITPGLSTAGKAVLIVLMIVGRLGPLAVIAAWAHRPTPRPFTNPEESLPVG